MQKPLKELGTQIHAFYRGNFGQNPPADSDSFGLEIELEGLGGEHWTEFSEKLPKLEGWRTVEDGSLRDGVEFVSNGPRPYSVLRDDLQHLSGTFTKLGFTPVFSFRTSLHVHMNAMHLSWRDVLKIYILYIIFERHLMEMGGAERQGNVHCLGAELAQRTIDDLREALQADIKVGGFNRYGDPINTSFAHEVAAVTDRGRRYAAFNFASLPTHGTIEFRNHRGTADTDTVMAWVDTLRAMRDYATSAVQTPIELLKRFSTLGEQAFAVEVFGQGSPIAVAVTQKPGETHTGMRLAQEIAFARTNWDTKAAPKPKVKKEIVDSYSEAVANFNDIDWAAFEQREEVRRVRQNVQRFEFNQWALRPAQVGPINNGN